MRRLRTAAVLMLSLALGGCISLLPKAPPVQLYQFGQGAADAAGPQPPPANSARTTVALGRVDLPRGAAGDALLTTRGEEAAYLADARWLAPAQVLFREAVVRAFRRRAAGLQLLDPGEAGPGASTLRVEVDEFDARYGAMAGPPTAVVSLHVRLSRADGSVAAERDLVARRPAAEDRLSAIVAAYDEATSDVLGELVAWTEGEAAHVSPDILSPPPKDRR